MTAIFLTYLCEWTFRNKDQSDASVIQYLWYNSEGGQLLFITLKKVNVDLPTLQSYLYLFSFQASWLKLWWLVPEFTTRNNFRHENIDPNPKPGKSESNENTDIFTRYMNKLIVFVLFSCLLPFKNIIRASIVWMSLKYES